MGTSWQFVCLEWLLFQFCFVCFSLFFKLCMKNSSDWTLLSLALTPSRGIQFFADTFVFMIRLFQVDAPNLNGNTPLHIACLNGQDIVISELMSYGASVNATNKKGMVCRMYSTLM